MKRHPYVIAISGPAGAGKTTLVQALADKLGGAATLFFDDFAPDCQWWPAYGSEKSPGDHYRKWIAKGADPNDYVSAPKFATAIAALRSSEMRFVIVEEPWGRARNETARLIDFVAHIDLPLDVALCRRLLRDAAQGADILKVIRSYHDQQFTHYYQRNRELPGSSADLVLDGMRSIEELIDELVDVIQQRLDAIPK
jgi:uridine kinase